MTTGTVPAMAGNRVGSALGVTLVAMVLAGLVTALVLSFVLEDDETAGPPVLTLAPAPATGPSRRGSSRVSRPRISPSSP